MSNIVPFEYASVPAFARAANGKGSIAAALAVSFPVLRYKGKVWSLSKADGERETIMREIDGDTQPAPYIDVVILDMGPSADRKLNAKVWYAKAFVEGEEASAPDCSSDDGVTPRADSKDKQADNCATCPKNVWGSGKNGVGRECGDSKRLAVATADDLKSPMLLTVPAGSLGGLNEYLNWLLKKGVDVCYATVTRIGFDYTAAHPKLTFKAIGWVSEDPTPHLENEQIDFIVGRKAMPKHETDAIPGDKPAFASKPKAPAKPAEGTAEAAKPKAPAKPAAPPAEPKPKAEKPKAPPADDDLPTAPKANVRIEGDDAPTAPKAKAEPVTVVEDTGDLDIDELDFDDE